MCFSWFTLLPALGMMLLSIDTPPEDGAIKPVYLWTGAAWAIFSFVIFPIIAREYDKRWSGNVEREDVERAPQPSSNASAVPQVMVQIPASTDSDDYNPPPAYEKHKTDVPVNTPEAPPEYQ